MTVAARKIGQYIIILGIYNFALSFEAEQKMHLETNSKCRRLPTSKPLEKREKTTKNYTL